MTAADLEAIQDELEEMFEKADELMVGGKASRGQDVQKIVEAVSYIRFLK